MRLFLHFGFSLLTLPAFFIMANTTFAAEAKLVANIGENGLIYTAKVLNDGRTVQYQQDGTILGGSCRSVGLADFNNDGRTDAIAGHLWYSTVRYALLLNDPEADFAVGDSFTFSVTDAVATTPVAGDNRGHGSISAVTLGDAPADGTYTITCTNESVDGGTFSVTGPAGALGTFTIGDPAFDAGDVSFEIFDGDRLVSQGHVGTISYNGWTEDAATGDFNNDGWIDFVGNSDSYDFAVFLNNGDNSFTPVHHSQQFRGRAMAAADFNHDGFLDLARAHYSSGQTVLMFGDGTGGFSNHHVMADTGSDPYGVAAGDFNNDGHPDLIINNSSAGTHWFYAGQGDGTFAASIVVAGVDPNNYSGIDSIDFNNDGNLDLLSNNYTGRKLYLIPGNGDGTFGAWQQVSTFNASANTMTCAAPPTPLPAGSPIADFTVSNLAPATGEAVDFDAAASTDDGSIVDYAWDFGDGTTNSGPALTTPSHTYTTEGTYVVTLVITDDDALGKKSVLRKTIFAGGAAPTVPSSTITLDTADASGGLWTQSYSPSDLATDAEGITGGSIQLANLWNEGFETTDLSDWEPTAGSWITSDANPLAETTSLVQTDTAASRTDMFYHEKIQGDFRFSADVRIDSGSGSEVMLLFAGLHENQNYELILRGRGYNDLLFYRSTSNNNAQQVDFNLSTTVSAGTTYNLAVERRGSAWSFFVNGEYVYTAYDSQLSDGKVGFGTYQTAATFDNLVLETFGTPINTNAAQTVTSGGSSPWGLTWDGSHWWKCNNGWVQKLNPDFSYVEQINVGDVYTGIEWDPVDQVFWAIDFSSNPGQVSKFSANWVEDAVVRDLPLGNNDPIGITTDGTYLYVNFREGYVRRYTKAGVETGTPIFMDTLVGYDFYGEGIHHHNGQLFVGSGSLNRGRVYQLDITDWDNPVVKRWFYPGASDINALAGDGDKLVLAHGNTHYLIPYTEVEPATKITVGPGTHTLELTATDAANQTVSETITITAAAGTPPTADASPTVTTYDQTDATDGAFNVTLTAADPGPATTAESYVWELPVEEFSGTEINPQRWDYSTDTLQNEYLEISNPNNNWGNRHLAHKDAFPRANGLAFECRIQAGSGNFMVGWKNTNSTYTYTQMHHAIYFANGQLHIYEDGASRGYRGINYTSGAWYEVRIEAKAAGGARYFFRPDGRSFWTLLYDSNYSTASPMRFAVDCYAGTWRLDDLQVFPAGQSVDTRLYGIGDTTIPLTVTDQFGQSQTTSTTITTSADAPPSVSDIPPIQLGEDDDADSIWTYSFDAANFVSDPDAIALYAWDFGNGVTATTASGSAQYLAPGTYPITLTVIDHAGQQTTKSTTLTIAGGNPPVASAPTSVIAEATANGIWQATLDGSASSDDHGITRYSWDLGTDTFDASWLDTRKWLAAGNFTLSNGQLVTPSPSNWSTHLQSTITVPNAPGTVFDCEITPASGYVRFGLHHPENAAAYQQLAYSTYFNNGSLQIFESGTNRGTVRSYSVGTTYQVRIELMPGGGARYWLREVTASRAFDPADWELIYVSTYQPAVDSFRYGISTYSGVHKLDNFRFLAGGATLVDQPIATPDDVQLIVQDATYQTASTTVAVTIPDNLPPVADAGGPYLSGENYPVIFDPYGSSDDLDAIQSFHWDFGDGNASASPSPRHAYAAPGTYTVTLTITDTAGHSDSHVTSATISEAPTVICVPWQFSGGVEIPHDAVSGQATRIKAVAYDADYPLAYTVDPGDGSAAYTGSINDGRYFEITHTYNLDAGIESKPFAATVTFTDSQGNSSSDTYLLSVKANHSLDVDLNIAIDEGLWYMHRHQRTADWAWLGSGYYIGPTASCLQAFLINGHSILGDANRNPYVLTVHRGMDALFSRLYPVAIGPQTYGDPDTNGDGIGITGGGARAPYELGQAMDAICATGLPIMRANTGAPYVRNRTYHEIVQNMVDTYAWGQSDHATIGGGWRYSWGDNPDNSAAQWGAIGMQPAEDIFKIDIPQWVKDRNLVWLDYSSPAVARSTGGNGFGYQPGTYIDASGGTAARDFGYTNTHPHGGDSTAVNASGMVQQAFNGVPSDNPLWVTTENWYATNWNTFINSNKLYSYYAFVKAMRLAKPNPIHRLAATNFEWFGSDSSNGAAADGIARKLVDTQLKSGTTWGTWNSALWIDQKISAPWGVIMLTRTLFTLPPVAVAGPDLVWRAGQPRSLNAGASYHLDPAREVTTYEWDADGDGNYDYLANKVVTDGVTSYQWDLDGDGNVDLTTDNPIISHSWPTAGVFTVSLRVSDDATDDNGNPLPQQDIDTFSVDVRDTLGVPPTAVITGPPVATAGIPVTLSGADSSDTDPTDFITLYEWDLDGDGAFDDLAGGPSTAGTFEWTFPDTLVGQVTVGLRVTDNAVGQENDTGLTNTNFFAIQIQGNSAPIAIIDGPDTTPEGTAITLDAGDSTDPNGDPLTYEWDLDDDGNFDDSTAPQVSFQRPANGSYNVSLRVSDPLTSSSTTRTITVTDKSPSADFFTQPLQPIEGHEVTFRDSSVSSPDAIVAYAWAFGDAANSTSTLADPTFTYDADGDYLVSLTVTDDDGSSTTISRTVTVEDAAPIANFTYSPVNPGIDDDITFTDISDPIVDTIVAWQWTFPDQAARVEVTDQNTTHAFPTIGRFPVTLVVTDADGSTASITRNIHVTEPADLKITSLTATPDPLFQGTKARITATLLNDAIGAVPTTFQVGFKIDDNPTQVVAVPGGMAPGQSRDVTFFWTVTPGTHSLTVDADFNNSVNEVNAAGDAENNNTASLDLGTVVAPDLAVSSVSPSPAAPADGELAQLTATITNNGARSGSIAQVRFEVDQTLLGQTTIPGLDAGASHTVTIPWPATIGAARTITVTVDPDDLIPESGDDANNTATGAIPAIAEANLVLADLSWQPATPILGQAVTFTATVHNDGAATKRNITVHFELDNAVIGSRTIIGGLAADATTTVTRTWVATFGDHQILAEVDRNDLIAEPGDDTDNVATAQLPTIAQPDVALSSLTVTPTNFVDGDATTFTAVVSNPKTVVIGQPVRIDFRLNGTSFASRTVPAGLAPGATHKISIPWLAIGGQHQITAIADPNDLIPETDEATNNEATLTVDAGDTPNLVVDSVTIAPAAPVQGEPTVITATITNNGGTTHRRFTSRLSVNGLPLLSKQSHAGLDAGDSITLTTTWPALAGNGHQITAITDLFGTITEVDEDDNQFVFNIPAISPPDLTVTGVTLSPANPIQGDTVTFTATIENLAGGTGDGNPGDTLLDVPVAFEIDGQTVASATITGGLAGQASTTVTGTWTATSGDHQLRVKVDPNAIIVEANELNNTLTETLPAVNFPNITVANLAIDPAAPGDAVETLITVEVTANTAPTNGPFHCQLSVDGEVVDVRRVNGMGRNQTKTVTFSWTATPGIHELVVLADANDVVPESNETDNEITLTLGEIPEAPQITLDLDPTGSHVDGTPFAGLQTIGWEAIPPVAQTPVTVNLELESTRSGTIYSLATGLDAIDTYDWNTQRAAGGARVPDGNYLLRATAIDDRGGNRAATSAPITIDNTPAVTVTIEAGLTILIDGETFETPVRIRNNQPAASVYILAITGLGRAANASLSETTVNLPAWGETTVTLSLDPDVSDLNLGVSATEQFTPARQQPLVGNDTFRLIVKPKFTVTPLTTPRTVSMGGSTTYRFRITNNQRSADTFELAAGGLPEEWRDLPEAVAVPAGGIRDVNVELSGLDLAGTFDLSLTATSRTNDQSASATRQITTTPDPLITALLPNNGTRFGARSVTIQWHTAVPASTEVYYTSEAIETARSSDYVRVDGTAGTRHKVTLENLERNHRYTFYVRSVSFFGEANSAPRTFIVDNGVVFSANSYPVTVERDYGIKVPITIRNTDVIPHEVLVQVDDVPDELAVGFVEAGADTRLLVPAGGRATVLLGVSTQDAIEESYQLPIRLTNLGAEPIFDDAVVDVSVHFPFTDFTLEQIGQDDRNLCRRVRLTNLGDPITDFSLFVDDQDLDRLRFEPGIDHGYLRTGQHLDFNVYPSLEPGFAPFETSIFVSGAGQTRELVLNFTPADNKTLFVKQLADYDLIPEEFLRPHLDDDLQVAVIESTDTSVSLRWYLPGTYDEDYVDYEISVVPAPGFVATVEQLEQDDPFYNLQSNSTVDGFQVTISQSAVTLLPPQEANASAAVGALTPYTVTVDITQEGPLTAAALAQHGYFANKAVALGTAVAIARSGSGAAARTDHDALYNTVHNLADGANGASYFFRKSLAPFGTYLKVGAGMAKAAADVAKFWRDRNDNAMRMLFPHRNKSWYCTNKPRVPTRYPTPPGVRPNDLLGANLGGHVDPNLSGDKPNPHDLDIGMNGTPIGNIQDSIPAGIINFPVPPSTLNYSNGVAPATNTALIEVSGFNPGHYASIFDFTLELALTNATVPVLADDEDGAHAYLYEQLMTHRPAADFSVYFEDVTHSLVAEEEVSRTTPYFQIRINNESVLPGSTAVETRVDGQVIDQRYVSVDEYSRTTFTVPFSPTSGSHQIEVAILGGTDENGRTANNNLTKTFEFSLPGFDTTAPVITALFPTANAEILTTDVRIGAAYSDNLGIATSSVVLTVDGNNVTSQAVVTETQVWLDQTAARSTLSQGEHTATVTVADPAGNVSTRSWSFIIELDAPKIRNVEAVDVTNTTAAIVWQTNVSTDGIALYGPAGSALDSQRFHDDYRTDHRINLNSLSRATTYYYDVFSTKRDGQASRSRGHSFYTGDNNAPSVPADPIPTAGATGIAATPTFSWSSTDDDPEDLVTFDLYLSTNPYPDTLVAENLADSSWEPPPLTYDTQYFWRIIATDSKGSQTLGDVWTFRTTTANGTPPEIAQLTLQVQPTGGDPSPSTEASNGDTILVDFTLNRQIANASVTLDDNTFTDNTGGRSTTVSFAYAVTGQETAGTFPIVIRGLDDGGNLFYDDSLTISLSFSGPTADFSANRTSGPAPLSVQFNDDSTGVPTSWFWEFGDGKSSTEQSPVHTYLNPGVYNVTLTVANGAGSDNLTRTDFVKCQGVTLELIRGWNLISMPVIPRVNSVEEVARGVLQGIPYTWSQQRRRYVRASRNTRSLNAFIPLQGYYFFSRADTALHIGGRPPASTFHTLENGWNVIGPARTGWYNIGDYIDNGWYLNPKRRRFIDVPRDGNLIFLEATRAYWLFLKHPNGELEIDLAAPFSR